MKSSKSVPAVPDRRGIATGSGTTVEITYQKLSPVILVTVAISLAGVVIGLNQLNPWLSPLVLVLSVMGIGGLLIQLYFGERRATSSVNQVENYANLAESSLAKCEPWLKANIRGQNEAVGVVVASLRQNLALARSGHILGAYFLVGPTGTGKTFLAQLLARALYPESEPVVLRMNQFKSANDVFTLLGPPPGLPGFEVGGALTRPVMENPRRVIVLDEIEKAHPDLHHCLYDILDAATCREKSSGKTVDFSCCVFFATCNSGVEALRMIRSRVNPMDDPASWLGQSRDALVSSTGFDRAFLARWTQILLMDELTPIHVAEVACLQLARHWHEYGIEVTFAAPELILEAVQGNEEFSQYGVRQLGNYIQMKTSNAIAQARLQGATKVRLLLGPGGRLQVVPEEEGV
jgi:ATP-dependent Clp protease ATP-binding subunit ClpA